MISALLAGLLAVAAPQQQTDTTFAVRAGGTIEFDAHSGSVHVRSWERDAIRIAARHNSRTDVQVRSRGSMVSVEASFERSGPAPVYYEVMVPRRYSVRADGVNLPVTVEGIQGGVRVDNVEGTVSVRGVTGNVVVSSVSGAVLVENTRGAVSVSTVNQGVRLVAVRGDIDAEAVNGSVVIRDAESANVRASTVNGLVEFSGALRERGRYYLGTHNGRITMSVPEAANAAVSIRTSNGKVQSSFPVPLAPLRDGNLSITMGSGSARVELETFNGTVYLVRPDGR